MARARFTLAQLKQSNAKIVSISPVRNKASRLAAGGVSPPHKLLWDAVSGRWPEAVKEHSPIEGRRFRIDIAFVEQRIAIEVDGWVYHGKHRSAHAKDRKRQNLLVQHGWRVLRFTTGEIFNDMPAVLVTIEALLTGQP